MKRPKFSEEQIVYGLRQPDPWHPLRGYLSAARQRRANLLGVENEVRHSGVSELRRLRQLEEENSRLKRLVADLSLDKHIRY